MAQNTGSAGGELRHEIEFILEEARMVLPGIQALFGFQLIAAFHERFGAASHSLQVLHLIALGLVVLSIALIMTPAAYHRQVQHDQVSVVFARYASRLITAAMVPLMFALALEVAVVSQVVFGNATLSAALAMVIFIIFTGLWYVFPRVQRSRSAGSRRK